MEVTGERRNSHDLPKGGMEIPASFIFKTENAEPFNQMREKTLEKLEEFEKKRKYRLEKSWKKKKEKIGKIVFFIFPPI